MTASDDISLDASALMALIDASRAINEALEPREVCARVARHAAEILGGEGASVLLHDAAQGELVFHTVIGPDATDVVLGTRFPADQGIAGQVVRTGRGVCVNDASENRNFYQGIDELTKLRTKSIVAVPLIHRDEVIGVVEIIDRVAGGSFTRSDLEVAQLLANLVAGSARLAQEVERLSKAARGLRESVPTAQFIGQSAGFRQVLRLCEKVAPSTTTVLLTGETGTGKEMAAQAIHAASSCNDGPFIAVNCAALPESLIESELFGHEKGAFTGATKQTPGRFELADGGTIFLDEIGELPLEMQSKLLRVLETREVRRVGGRELVRCDVRVIAATNRDLKKESGEGRFREDLYYRLSVFPIELPPLRERIDDLPLLVEHLMARVAPSLAIRLPEISAAAMDCLRRYAWPGNIRELRNVIERAALLADEEIMPDDLPRDIADARGASTPVPAEANASLLEEKERELITAALMEANWNQSAAARNLGITRDMLRSRMKRYQLAPPRSA